MRLFTHPRAGGAGGIGSILFLFWEMYSHLQTAEGVPQDARRALHLFEQSPPWILFVPFALLLIWGVWPERKKPPEPIPSGSPETETPVGVARPAPAQPQATPTLDRKTIALANAYEARQRADELNKHIASISAKLTQLPPSVDEPDIEVRGRTRREHALAGAARFERATLSVLDGAKRRLTEQGFPMEGWDAAGEAAKARIKGDAEYIAILPDDAAYAWTEGRQKRNWWLLRAEVEAKLSFLSTLRDRYEQDADWLTKHGGNP